MVGAIPDSVRDGSFQFAVRVMRLCEDLPRTSVPQIVSPLLIEAATRVGEKIEQIDGIASREGYYEGLAEARRRARSARFWLRMLLEANVPMDRDEAKVLIGYADKLAEAVQKMIKTSVL